MLDLKKIMLGLADKELRLDRQKKVLGSYLKLAEDERGSFDERLSALVESDFKSKFSIHPQK